MLLINIDHTWASSVISSGKFPNINFSFHLFWVLTRKEKESCHCLNFFYVNAIFSQAQKRCMSTEGLWDRPAMGTLWIPISLVNQCECVVQAETNKETGVGETAGCRSLMLKGGFTLLAFLPSLVPLEALLWLQGGELTPSFHRVSFSPALLHKETRLSGLGMGEAGGRLLLSALILVDQVSQAAKLPISAKAFLLWASSLLGSTRDVLQAESVNISLFLVSSWSQWLLFG